MLSLKSAYHHTMVFCFFLAVSLLYLSNPAVAIGDLVSEDFSVTADAATVTCPDGNPSTNGTATGCDRGGAANQCGEEGLVWNGTACVTATKCANGVDPTTNTCISDSTGNTGGSTSNGGNGTSPGNNAAPASGGTAVKGESLPDEDKDPLVCSTSQKNQKTTVFTCEGYPAINPNISKTSDIGSADGINTDCGKANDEFISSKGMGYNSYEFAERYWWFRWGINLGPNAVVSAVPNPASAAKSPPLETDLKTPAPNARNGIGSSFASATGLCSGSESALNDILDKAGAVAFTPKEITDTKQPVPGDLIVLKSGHIGPIVGTATGKGSNKIIDVTWANEGNVANPPAGGYSNLPPGDSSICMYLHANANTSTVANSCTPGGKGQGTGDPSKGGAGGPAAPGSSVTGSVSGTISATGKTAQDLDTGNIAGKITSGKLTSTGTVSGTITATITGSGTNATITTPTPTQGLNGNLTADFTALFADKTLSDLTFPSPTTAVLNKVSGPASGTLEFGQIQNAKITDATTGAFTASISGIDTNGGKVTGAITGTIGVKGSVQSGSPTGKQVNYSVSLTLKSFVFFSITGTITGTWDAQGQFNGTFTESKNGCTDEQDISCTIAKATITNGAFTIQRTFPSNPSLNDSLSVTIDNGSDAVTKVTGSFKFGDNPGTLTGSPAQ